VVRVWDTATWTELTVLDGHTYWVLDVAWSPDGERLASASYDDSRTGRHRREVLIAARDVALCPYLDALIDVVRSEILLDALRGTMLGTPIDAILILESIDNS